MLKLMTSQPGKETISMHLFPNISRSTGNQTMKFVQLIKYNTRNIFPEKICAKFCGATIPRPFPKKSKSSLSLHQ